MLKKAMCKINTHKNYFILFNSLKGIFTSLLDLRKIDMHKN